MSDCPVDIFKREIKVNGEVWLQIKWLTGKWHLAIPEAGKELDVSPVFLVKEDNETEKS